MIPKKHFSEFNKIAKHNLVRLHKITTIYQYKKHDYFMRDLRLGKAVSLVNPMIQQERAYNTIMRANQKGYDFDLYDLYKPI